jgi:hypothetical protein
MQSRIPYFQVEERLMENGLKLKNIRQNEFLIKEVKKVLEGLYGIYNGGGRKKFVVFYFYCFFFFFSVLVVYKGCIKRIYNFALRKDEKHFLWIKYVRSGLSPDVANELLKERQERIRDVVRKLVKKKKSPEKIQERFEMEFTKLVEGR